MILPRQARDKHRENSKKSPFCDQLPRGRLLLLYNSSAAHHGLVYPRGAVATGCGSRWQQETPAGRATNQVDRSRQMETFNLLLIYVPTTYIML
jgi:hypothetical protein